MSDPLPTSLPDAPRAGGETPDSRPALDREAKCSVCSHDREMHGDDAPDLLGCGMIGCQCSAFDGRFAALPSLLERHRDGERLDWLEHCNSQKRGEVPILPPSCGYSVRQYIDAQLADANTPCAAGPSPERA